MASRQRDDGHDCAECGFQSPRWFGRCPDCGTWNAARNRADERAEALRITSLAEPAQEVGRNPTGVPEVDRVLGGGLVAGGVVLLAGEPGIGKSTLVLQVVDGLVRRDRGTLLITGEESVAQVALRAKRLEVAAGRFRVAASCSLPEVLSAAAGERPDVLLVDSIQTLEDPALEQPAGSVPQVKACAAALTRHAKSTGTAVVLVGHVTKEGTVAGPKTLEHMVDAVLTLEGERSGTVRLLRASKNRFGSCDETGVFTMSGRGLEAVGDPSAMLLEDRRAGVSGSIVFPGLEGSRPMLVELQALVSKSDLTQPRRVPLGVDAKRLALLMGVMANDAGGGFAGSDVFVAAAGGLTVREPAADLALCLALHSAREKRPMAGDLVAVGELGLGGEVRRVPGIERRLVEAARLGFRRAIVPRGAGQGRAEIDTAEVGDLREALERAYAHGHLQSALRPTAPHGLVGAAPSP